jgi:hypothetical protein
MNLSLKNTCAVIDNAVIDCRPIRLHVDCETYSNFMFLLDDQQYNSDVVIKPCAENVYILYILYIRLSGRKSNKRSGRTFKQRLLKMINN